MPESGDVEGAARLSRTLDAAARELGELDNADAAASRIIANAARARAPRRTGTLAGSVRADPSEGAGRVVVGADYAGYVEFGVPSRHIAARPFLADAAEATRPVVVDVYSKSVEQAIGHVKGA